MVGEKFNIFNKMKTFFVDYKNEVKRIAWPTPKTAFKNTGVVFAMILVIGIFVFLLDMGMTQILSLIMSVSR